MRILIVPMSWGRGVGPVMEALSIANAFRKQGREPYIAAKPSFHRTLKEHGFKQLFPLPERPSRPLTPMFYSDFAAFQGLADVSYMRAILAAEESAICKCRPDLLLSILQPTASVSARSNQICHAAEARWTEHPKFSVASGRKGGNLEVPPPSAATLVANTLLRERSLPEVQDLWDLSFLFSDIKFAGSSRQFEPGLKDVSGIKFIGYIEGIEDVGKHTEPALEKWINAPGKKVFAYLSAKHYDPHALAFAFSEAFGPKDAHLLIATGTSAMRTKRVFQNVVMTRWVNARRALKAADALISVGTRTLSLQAVLAGVGNLVLPGGDDELCFIVNRLERLGCAERLAGSNILKDELRRGVNRISSADIRQKITAQGRKLARLGGPNALVEHILKIRSSS